MTVVNRRDKGECDECGANRFRVLLQVCVPYDDEANPHEKILDIFMCRECIAKMGTLGMWIVDAVRSHMAKDAS